MYFFNLFHQNSKHRIKALRELLPREQWPESWKTIFFKTYPRFKTYPLPTPVLPPLSLSETLTLRESSRVFEKEITLENLSTMLKFALGERSDGEEGRPYRRMYPSAGARYPLEFYILLFKNIGELIPGVYHFNVAEHGLTHLKPLSITDDFFQSISLEAFTKNAHGALLCTAVSLRSREKYGERSYRFMLLEAGAAMQNVALVATALNLPTVSLGGMIDDSTEELLGVDGTEEFLIHTLLF
jgi:SagB-type dehydrogenase family enzyme